MRVQKKHQQSRYYIGKVDYSQSRKIKIKKGAKKWLMKEETPL